MFAFLHEKNPEVFVKYKVNLKKKKNVMLSGFPVCQVVDHKNIQKKKL